jgi:hypothetical protein
LEFQDFGAENNARTTIPNPLPPKCEFAFPEASDPSDSPPGNGTKASEPFHENPSGGPAEYAD